MCGLGCEHYYCLDCWFMYIKVAILENKSACVTCPESKCKLIVDDSIVLQIIKKDPDLVKRFYRTIGNSFVKSSKTFLWCPGVNCNYLVMHKNEPTFPIEIFCTNCETVFCSFCGHQWHSPVPCKYQKRWLELLASDSGTSHWITANTKFCPKCDSSIEKNGGCNHMTCSNCRFDFCWICMKDWKKHDGGYNCNVFDSGENDRSNAKNFLARFVFYHTRYEVHDNSRKLEEKISLKIRQNLDEIIDVGTAWLNERLCTNAINVLTKCRRTLMYSYVFAYFILRSNLSQIFEENQRDLERATEDLSFLLESEAVADVIKFKSKLEELVTYCSKRRQVLIDHVKEGENLCQWEYMNPNENLIPT